ncbi:MAG TPA: ABC transporter permease, partial [Acidimicrobiales bacterium]|nr:ABC transporter permease [Acidimicrobiales bacterium]
VPGAAGGGHAGGRRDPTRTWALPPVLTGALPMLREAEREARIWARLWHTSLLTGVLMPLLFLGAIGVGLGGLVDENSGTVEGVSYLVFVTPGILAATALQGASGESLWPVMAGIKWVKTFHAAAASPMSPGQVYGGWVTWVTARLLINATLFVIVAALLGGVASWWAVTAPLAAALGGLAFAAPVTAYSAGRESDLSFSIIMRVAVMPMFLFSGTFFPIDQLPDWLQPLARISPLWHAVELCRGATTGSITLVGAVVHVAFLVAIVLLGCWWGVRTFERRLAP